MQIAHSFPTSNSAGTEIYTCLLSRQLSREHEVSVVYRVNSPGRKDFSVKRGTFGGIRTFEVNNTFASCSGFSQTYRDERVGRAVGLILDEVSPDIVHIQHLLFLSVSVIEEIDRRRIPVIFTLHDYWLLCPQGQLFDRSGKNCQMSVEADCYDCRKYQMAIRNGVMSVYGALQRCLPAVILQMIKKAYFLSARATFLNDRSGMSCLKERREYISSVCEKVCFFTAPSGFLRRKFVSAGFGEHKIRFMPYGFDHSLFGEKSVKRTGKTIVVFIGTLLPAKGPDLLIKAFSGLRGGKAELKIYGRLIPYRGYEGYISSLKRLAKGKNIFFMGGFDNQKVGEVLKEADVLVVPSRWQENSPLVIQEAQLAGVPVIASDIGGIPELVSDGENGLLFRPGDSDDLNRKLRKLIDDPDLVKRLKKGCRLPERIEDNCRKMTELYRQALLLKDKALAA